MSFNSEQLTLSIPGLSQAFGTLNPDYTPASEAATKAKAKREKTIYNAHRVASRVYRLTLVINDPALIYDEETAPVLSGSTYSSFSIVSRIPLFQFLPWGTR